MAEESPGLWVPGELWNVSCTSEFVPLGGKEGSIPNIPSHSEVSHRAAEARECTVGNKLPLSKQTRWLQQPQSELEGKVTPWAASHAAQKSWDLGSVSGVSPRVLTEDVINEWINEQVQGPHPSIRAHMVPVFALYYVYLHPHYPVLYGLDFGKERWFSQRANFSLSRTLGFGHKPLQWQRQQNWVGFQSQTFQRTGITSAWVWPQERRDHCGPGPGIRMDRKGFNVTLHLSLSEWPKSKWDPASPSPGQHEKVIESPMWEQKKKRSKSVSPWGVAINSPEDKFLCP